MTMIKPIHPFPARMAPEIVLNSLSKSRNKKILLDPMVGSGTVVKVASENCYNCIGFDRDPLAVLMTRVWTQIMDGKEFNNHAKVLINKFEEKKNSDFTLKWIDEDKETEEFINFWFAKEQSNDLRILSSLLVDETGVEADALKIALSRLIITKERGASLGRDISHSRPHRRKDLTNEFNVIENFKKSVSFLSKRLSERKAGGNVEVKLADARKLPLEENTIDLVVTSPPYLNAVDYMRGHKLSLVWLGYTIGELRRIRSGNIGAEKAPDHGNYTSIAGKLLSGLKGIENLSNREQCMISRYAEDVFLFTKEIERVLKHNGKAVLVVGNSCLKGVFVENTEILCSAARMLGMKIMDRVEREIPANRRYLPMPDAATISGLQKRMRTESIISFTKN